MGGNTSRTRKLTIENENATNVIKVSDDVIERLKGKQRQVRNPDETSITSRDDVPVVASPLFLQEPSLTSLQLRQQKLEELKKNDEYWEKRIKNLEGCHKKINEIMEEEYKKTLDEQGKRIPVKDTKEISKLLPPCHDVELEVIACYKQNTKNPINCSNIVQAFQDCVDEKRYTIMAGRC